MTDDALDISGILTAIKKRRFPLLLFVAIVTAAALIIALLLPKKYYSSSTLFPANTALQDKGRIFNPNIQQLYSGFGSGDDIDRLHAIASSDRMYLFLTDSFQLAKHYGCDGDAEEANDKAVRQVEKLSVIRRTVNGELEVGIWDKDKKLAAGIANTIVSRIQIVYDEMMLNMNENTLSALKDALNKQSNPADSSLLLRQISELEININSHPPAFVVVQKAHPAVKAGKPRVFIIVMAGFLISLFFGLLAIVIADKVKS